MRLSDFDGYEHGAANPMWHLPESMERTIPENGTLDLRLTLTMPAATAGAIRLKDMRMPGMAFGNWYPGIVIFDSYDTYAVTSGKVSGELGGNLVLDFGAFGSEAAGTYTAVPIMASEPISPGDTGRAVDIVQMGASSALVLKNQEPSYSMGIKGTRSASGTTITATVSVTCRNTTSAAHVFPGVTVRIAKDSSGTGAVTLRSLGDITVEAGQGKTVNATVNLTSVFGTKASQYSYVKAICSSAQVKETSWAPTLDDFSGGLTPVDPVTPGTVL